MKHLIITALIIFANLWAAEGQVFHFDQYDRDLLNEIIDEVRIIIKKSEVSNHYNYYQEWRLKNGNTYTSDALLFNSKKNPSLPVVPPIFSKTIGVEGDIKNLKDNGFFMVYVALRYMQFGKENEAIMVLNVEEGTRPYIERKIYTDRDASQYVYRLVFVHKDHGNLMLPWKSLVRDNFIYINAPEGLANPKSEIHKRAKKLAKEYKKDDSRKVIESFQRSN
ncbi:hypothetical protein [Flavivirga jejuensis]|uniref:GLPGLI family protein n=1 Tax=Flavivirga jejuensis TaxID=870487 RepID=A0ABT8WSS9_9FLAO|nr:hypothetical protein [Flavivirga jejuensis]MDO5976233.1 hypothetical protein [Flavivirga jejuensis]